MNSIIRRFDRAPLEDRLLRANPAQPPKGKGDKSGPGLKGPIGGPGGGQGYDRRQGSSAGRAPAAGAPSGGGPAGGAGRGGDKRRRPSGPPSAFAEELAKAL